MASNNTLNRDRISMMTNTACAAILVSLASLISSCCSDTSVSPQTAVQPKDGSTFKFENHAIDNRTGLPFGEEKDTSTYTFLASSIEYAGKSNVSMLKLIDKQGERRVYINYESNGDVSIYILAYGSKEVWTTIPVGSEKAIFQTAIDTTIDVGEQLVHREVTVLTSYEGSEILNVSGQSLTTLKIKQEWTVSDTQQNATNTATYEVIYHYAPSIAFIIRAKNASPISQPDMSNPFGTLSMLIDY